MGCGSLSTTAFPPNYGTLGGVKGQHFPEDKDKSVNASSNKIRPQQPTKLPQGYSKLDPIQVNPENGSGIVRNTCIPANGDHVKNTDPINRFTISMKEIDEEKYKNDDGGIWLGTDDNEAEQTRNKTASASPQHFKHEDFSSQSFLKNQNANISDVDIVGLSAKSPTHVDQEQHSKPTTSKEASVIGTESSVKALPSTASFLRRSQKHRHLQDHRSTYDSVEESYSNGFGHFDDDKQMSDSELDDYASGLAASETGLFLNEDKLFSDLHGDDFQFTNIEEGDGDSGRSNMPSRVHDDQNVDTYNIQSDYPKLGVASKEHGKQSPTKSREAMFETFHKQMSLESLPAFPDTPLVPHFMVKCVRYIEAEGLKTEGLYRISGSKSLGEHFLNQYSADPEVDMAASEIPVHVIATLLKSFVNNLDQALIPSNVYDELVDAIDVADKSSQLAQQREIIKKLPEQQFAVLKYIIDHLHKVSKCQEFNSMNSRNLAKCWWPTLIRLQFRTYDNLVQGTQVPEQIVQTLIEHCDFFFHDGNEV